MTLSALTLSIMFALRSFYGETAPAWADTYGATADAIAVVCASRPLSGTTPEQCVSLYAEMAWHESRFQPDAVGDHGTAHGLFQIHDATLGRPVPVDAQGQAWAASELLETSFRICARHPLDERLGWFAAGGSGCLRRLALSRFRVHEAARMLRGVKAQKVAVAATPGRGEL